MPVLWEMTTTRGNCLFLVVTKRLYKRMRTSVSRSIRPFVHQSLSTVALLIYVMPYRGQKLSTTICFFCPTPVNSCKLQMSEKHKTCFSIISTFLSILLGIVIAQDWIKVPQSSYLPPNSKCNLTTRLFSALSPSPVPDPSEAIAHKYWKNTPGHVKLDKAFYGRRHSVLAVSTLHLAVVAIKHKSYFQS